MPEADTTELSVRFFVSVAAEALIRDNDMGYSPFLFSILSYFTRHAGVHVTHRIVKHLLLDAGRTDILATATNRLFWSGVGTSKLTGGTDIETPPTLTANFRVLVKGRSQTSLFPAASKTDGVGCHLFLAHPHAASAEDTVFMLLPEALLVDRMGGSQILDRFGLGTGGQEQFQNHLACLHDP
jgi:hypothetical protein